MHLCCGRTDHGLLVHPPGPKPEIENFELYVLNGPAATVHFYNDFLQITDHVSIVLGSGLPKISQLKTACRRNHLHMLSQQEIEKAHGMRILRLATLSEFMQTLLLFLDL